MTQYLSFEEREKFRKEMYEHRVFVAQHEERMKALRKEARSLRWQIFKVKVRNLFSFSR